MTTEPTPDGKDWPSVEPGTRYTAPQAARMFLDADWEQQVAMMELTTRAADAERRCFIQDHAGAVHFVQNHQCRPDRYDDGWRDGLDELARRVKEEFNPAGTDEILRLAGVPKPLTEADEKGQER